KPDGDRADHALAHVVAVELPPGEFVDGLEQALAEGAEVGAAVARVLAVDERPERLAEAAVAVREAELERPGGVVKGRVDRLVLHLVEDELEQAALRDVLPAVPDEPQAAVEIGVMAEPVVDMLRLVLAGLEDLGVRPEGDERAVRLVRP